MSVKCELLFINNKISPISNVMVGRGRLRISSRILHELMITISVVLIQSCADIKGGWDFSIIEERENRFDFLIPKSLSALKHCNS